MEKKGVQTAKKLPVKQKKTEEEKRLAHCISQAAHYQRKKEDEAFKAKRKQYNDVGILHLYKRCRTIIPWTTRKVHPYY